MVLANMVENGNLSFSTTKLPLRKSICSRLIGGTRTMVAISSYGFPSPQMPLPRLDYSMPNSNDLSYSLSMDIFTVLLLRLNTSDHCVKPVLSSLSGPCATLRRSSIA